jgi:hypothetical protein
MERDAKSAGAGPASTSELKLSDVRFVQYTDEETQMAPLMELIDKELSEPYSIFTYRYFINNWPSLCFLAHVGEHCIGVVICKVRARLSPSISARPAPHICIACLEKGFFSFFLLLLFSADILCASSSSSSSSSSFPPSNCDVCNPINTVGPAPRQLPRVRGHAGGGQAVPEAQAGLRAGQPRAGGDGGVHQLMTPRKVHVTNPIPGSDSPGRAYGQQHRLMTASVVR